MGTIRNRPHSIQEGSMVAIEDDVDHVGSRRGSEKGDFDPVREGWRLGLTGLVTVTSEDYPG